MTVLADPDGGDERITVFLNRIEDQTLTLAQGAEDGALERPWAEKDL